MTKQNIKFTIQCSTWDDKMCYKGYWMGWNDEAHDNNDKVWVGMTG